MLQLQQHQNWNNSKENVVLCDIVLLMRESHCKDLPEGVIVESIPDNDGIEGSAKFQLSIVSGDNLSQEFVQLINLYYSWKNKGCDFLMMRPDGFKMSQEL